MGVVILTIVACWVVGLNYKSRVPRVSKGSEKEKFPGRPVFPPTKPPIKRNPLPRTFQIDNIPAERKHDWGGKWELDSAEEKTVIESLASQVNINKSKSFFDYNWGFNMVPGICEVRSDSDHAFYLFTDQGKFFVKINNYSDLSRFEYEKESMLTINEAVPDLAPHPICLGNLPNGGKFLVVNFIEARWGDRLIVENQKLLAKSLAQLHQKKSANSKFGFHVGKNNQWKDNWEKFFQENRWQPLWKRVLEKYPHDKELKKWGEIIGTKVIPDLLGNLPVEPVLTHGNLEFDSWDINSQTKQPWVFDTHSYYGHNEMDLSLIHYYWPPDKFPDYRLKKCEGEFFEAEFIAEYQKHNPLPPGFEKRRDLYRFYYYLYRGIAWRKLIPGQKFYKKCLDMMKKLGRKNG